MDHDLQGMLGLTVLEPEALLATLWLREEHVACCLTSPSVTTHFKRSVMAPPTRADALETLGSGLWEDAQVGEGVTAGPTCHPDHLWVVPLLWQPSSPHMLAAVFLKRRLAQGVPNILPSDLTSHKNEDLTVDLDSYNICTNVGQDYGCV